MKPVNIGVLGLQGDIEEHESALRKAFNQLGQEGIATRVKTVRDAETVQGLIIPGGESTSIGLLAQNKQILETIQNRISKGLPTLGTCAGLIMLADRVHDRVLGEIKQPLIGGLDITVERNSFGRQRESFEADLSIPMLGQLDFPGIFIRSPVVQRVSSRVEVLSKLEDKIVAVKQDNMIGTCFHPELSGELRLHEYFIQLVSRNPLLA